jgi:hypothetical protein
MELLESIPVAQIAVICHEANRALCESFGDLSQRAWPLAEAWQRESAIKGVEFALSHPDAPASAQHDEWMRQKIADGWRYGVVKNVALREHPCMVPFKQLPYEQRVKDFLFRAIVKAFVEAAA